MTLSRCITIPLAALLLANAAHGQTLKPGLWETRSSMQGSAEMNKAMDDMQKQLAAMPPEQRKQMQDMMAKQGMNLGSAGPGGMSVQLCMTKDMVERNEIPAQDGQCKTTTSQRSGNTMKMSFTCTTPPSSGEGEVRFISPEAYTTRMVITTAQNGKRETMTMTGDSKWLSAQCGAVKPITGK